MVRKMKEWRIPGILCAAGSARRVRFLQSSVHFAWDDDVSRSGAHALLHHALQQEKCGNRLVALASVYKGNVEN